MLLTVQFFPLQLDMLFQQITFSGELQLQSQGVAVYLYHIEIPMVK